jgi:hypothetical protein
VVKLSRRQRRELRLRRKLAEKRQRQVPRADALRRLQSPMVMIENALAELGVEEPIRGGMAEIFHANPGAAWNKK